MFSTFKNDYDALLTTDLIMIWPDIESEQKSAQICHFTSSKVKLLNTNCATKGQNETFPGLKWGIVCICTLTGSWDVVKNMKIYTFL